MKKLMIAAAVAATAGIAGAIESANVVGYQNKGLADGVFNTVCHTFKAVDGRLWTLGDLIPSDDFSASSVQFATGTGSTKKFTLPNGDEVEGLFEYWREDEIDDGDLPDGATATTGWYLWGEDGKLYLMSNVQIPEGGCYIVDAHDGDAATLGGAGQVDAEDTDLPLTDGVFNWYGNCSPVDLTLADIAVSEDFSASSLQFMTGSGATKKVTLPNGDEVEGLFEYWRDEEIDEGDLPDGASATTGWYLWGEDGKLYLMSSTSVPSGAGFIIDAHDGDSAYVTIPSAL